ncbi:MAG: hypothetical protein AAFX40_14185 [Cyanobacteria bacterium J06639_1]
MQLQLLLTCRSHFEMHGQVQQSVQAYLAGREYRLDTAQRGYEHLSFFVRKLSSDASRLVMDSKKERQLRKILRDVGIDNADQWVSEADAYMEPIPMAEMALFLREAWQPILRQNDISWIVPLIKELESRQGRKDLYALRFLPPKTVLRQALQRLQAAGIDPKDLTIVIREFQLEVLAQVIDLLDGGISFEEDFESNWSIFSLDDELEPVDSFSDMKHLIWEFDPDREDV